MDHCRRHVLESAAVGLAGGAGLSAAEVLRRRAGNGGNGQTEPTDHPLQLALGKLWAPVPWMLELVLLLQLALGEYPEATAIGVLLLFNAGLAFGQERRAQATLDALRSRLPLHASVRRDGNWCVLAASALVDGDLIRLSLGEVVPADVRLLSGALLIDQSMLTGESVPVEAGAGFVAFAGALVRRGEAVAEVVATGARTTFGRNAELIRTAHVESTQQKTVMHVVRNLALFNGSVIAVLIAVAVHLGLPFAQIAPLVLVAMLASIPVALPSMFTLAATVGARALAERGVLPTRLSALDEAAGMDVLCVDKTGTLTRNAMAVTACRALPGFEPAGVLALAALASSGRGTDPLDAAIRAAAPAQTDHPWTLQSFLPFDPARKLAEAMVTDANGQTLRVIKGAYAVLAPMADASPTAGALVHELEGQGFRVLALAIGAPPALQLAGVIALSDPTRDDAAALVSQLRSLGVRTVMVTGDSAVTAKWVADAVGIQGALCTAMPLPADVQPDQYGVFARVLPEEKFALVQALQRAGHVVGMCGDGTNDAPALRQAQMGVAVFTATDVAKSAAGLVLTEPGLSGVVAAVEEGRIMFQRVLTYTLRSIIHKVVQVLFLLAGLLISGQAVLTPLLMVMMMVAGDFLAISSATDNVRPSATPNVWRIGHLTLAAIALGVCDLGFCIGSLVLGRYQWGLDAQSLRTLTVITLVFSGQAVFYVSRERRHLWCSRPGAWLMASTVLDVLVFSVFAVNGVMMVALPVRMVLGVMVAAAGLAFVLDVVKLRLFAHLRIA